MSENEIEKPLVKIVSLTCGATVIIVRLLQAPGWNKTPKEKHAAGRIQLKTEELILSQPDAPDDADKIASLAKAHNKAAMAWERMQAPALELSELQFQTVQTCLKYFTVREETGANRFLSELQEAFRVLE